MICCLLTECCQLGEKSKLEELTFVTFEPKEEGFVGSVPMDQLDSLGKHPELLLNKATGIYARAIEEMRRLLSGMADLKDKRQPVPARIVWELGDNIFNLSHSLKQASLELDDLYAHLTRDLGVKRMWLEKVVILRRYIERQDTIPETLIWSKFYSAPKKAAMSLLKG